MFQIYFGELPEAIYNTSVYFDNTYLDSWLNDDFSKKMIQAIDQATVLSGRAIDSKALGVIPVTQLSGGLKTLLLLQHDHSQIFNASTCGNNCAKWILKIAKRNPEDLTVNLHHLMDFGNKKYEIKILNNNTVVHNQEEYILTAGHFLREAIE